MTPALSFAVMVMWLHFLCMFPPDCSMVRSDFCSLICMAGISPYSMHIFGSLAATVSLNTFPVRDLKGKGY